MGMRKEKKEVSRKGFVTLIIVKNLTKIIFKK